MIELRRDLDRHDTLDGQCNIKELFGTISRDNKKRESLKEYLERSRLNGHYDLTGDDLQTWESRTLTIAFLIARKDIYPPIEENCLENQIQLLGQFNDQPIPVEQISILEPNGNESPIFRICCGDQSEFKRNRLWLLGLEEFFEIPDNSTLEDDISLQSP